VGLDFGQMHGWIVDELTRRRPVAESMTSLIDQCDAARPHPDWAKLGTLPYADLSPLHKWVQVPFREEPPEVPLKGLWFGLFNPCPDGRTPVADIYVCGSERFDPDPHDNSWAVGPDWWPAARCANSAVLADIYRIAYRQGSRVTEQNACLGNDAEYPLVLGYGVFAVRELLGQVEALLPGRAESLGVAVGFDSGDFVLLGELTSGGLKPIDPNAERPEVSIEPVLEGLRSSDGKKVFRAVFELHRHGVRARAAIPELLRVAHSDDFGLRQAAVNILAAVAPDDPRSKATALQALNDSSPSVRREALQALIAIKGLSATDLARIKDRENDADKDVARWSEIALRNIRLRDEADHPNDAADRGD
jgi:HEAT repeats